MVIILQPSGMKPDEYNWIIAPLEKQISRVREILVELICNIVMLFATMRI